MTTVRDIYNHLDNLFPFELAMEFDNVGVLVGDSDAVVDKVLVTLDITENTVKEARILGADLIISHHPVIFNPLKKIEYNDVIYKLIDYKINTICAHTNLDIAHGGVNTCLAESLGVQNTEVLAPLDNYNGLGLGLVGEVESFFTCDDFAKFVKEKLGCSGLRYTKLPEKIIKKVAVGSGSCGDLISNAIAKGADAFVTGEIKYHETLVALQNNVMALDVGHFCSEKVVIEPLTSTLKYQFPELEFFESSVYPDKMSYI